MSATAGAATPYMTAHERVTSVWRHPLILITGHLAENVCQGVGKPPTHEQSARRASGKSKQTTVFIQSLARSLLIIKFGSSHAYYLFIAIFERVKPTPLEQRELEESNTHEISTG
jgi:hypothetical protein